MQEFSHQSHLSLWAGLQDGILFVNLGDDLFFKTIVRSNGLLANDDNSWPGKESKFLITDPSFTLSTSAIPESTFATTNETSCSCEGGKHALTIELTTDNDSKFENVMLIESMCSSA